MYKRSFFVDHSSWTSQNFTTVGTARVRLNQTSFRSEDGPDQRDAFVAKSSKPFLIIVTTTAKITSDGYAQLDGETIILVVNKNNVDDGATIGIALSKGLRSIFLETISKSK